MATEIKDITTLFPKELQHMLKLDREVGTTAVALTTPPEIVQECATKLEEIAIAVGKGILAHTLDEKTLYRIATDQARQTEGDVIPGLHYYFALRRGHVMVLQQRIPFGIDTQPEIHKTGIEVYLPLTEGIDFFVNDMRFQPSSLAKVITILPGDLHHHIKERGTGPARVLIFGAFGFGKGVKTADTSFVVPEFADIHRIRSV